MQETEDFCGLQRVDAIALRGISSVAPLAVLHFLFDSFQQHDEQSGRSVYRLRDHRTSSSRIPMYTVTFTYPFSAVTRKWQTRYRRCLKVIWTILWWA